MVRAEQGSAAVQNRIRVFAGTQQAQHAIAQDGVVTARAGQKRHALLEWALEHFPEQSVHLGETLEGALRV
jgi:hypothetical protein